MRLPDYATDRTWADSFEPEIRRVLKSCSHRILRMEVAPEHKDVKQATDYIVKADTGDIACRIRRSEYAYRDWTIRYSRPNGTETEYKKLVEGFADFYLYAWAGKTSYCFRDWMLIDLHLVRIQNLLRRTDWEIKPNADGTRFMAIPAKCLTRCLLANSMDIPVVPDDPHWYDENIASEEYDEQRFIVSGPQSQINF